MKKSYNILTVALFFVGFLLYPGSRNNQANATPEYGNGRYGFCYSGCWPTGIEIVCYPWFDSYCIGTPCTSGWCD